METMYISVDESQMSVFFLDCFRFCMNDTEYNKTFCEILGSDIIQE